MHALLHQLLQHFFCHNRTVSQSSAHRLDAFCHCLFASSCFKNTDRHIVCAHPAVTVPQTQKRRFSDHSQTSRWKDKRKRTLDPVSQQRCEPLREMLSCHRLILASLQLSVLLSVSLTDSRRLKCSPGKVCSNRPPVVLSKLIYYSTSSVLKCPVAFLYLTHSCLLVS